MMRTVQSKKLKAVAIGVPAALGAGWILRRILSSTAAVPEESKGSQETTEAAEAASSGIAEKVGEVAGRIKPEKAQEKAGEALEQLQEAKEKASQIAGQAGEAFKSARESVTETAPGTISWFRRNQKLVWGIAAGAISALGLVIWRRVRREKRGGPEA